MPFRFTPFRFTPARRFAAASLSLLACGGTPQATRATPPPPPAPSASALAAASPTAPSVSPRPAPETLTADSPRTTAGGSTLKAPAGWTIEQGASRVILTAPEPDLRLAIVDAKGATADEAVASAWPLFDPAFKRSVKLAMPQPARDGWEDARDYDYETSPNEKLVVFAAARRHGDAWTVLLSEGGEASFQKRKASVDLVTQSLRPAGYTKESFAGKTANPLDAARLKEIADFADHARDVAGIPGVALSLVQADRVLFEGGFGVRELGKTAKVDADTLFMIASNTKALTTLLLAELIDDGKLGWDTPVTQVYPGFKLGDAETTSKVLVKHLVCACTGLPRQDFEWFFQFKDATPATEMAFLGTIQPTSKFGETYQYSNVLAAAAGFVAAKVVSPKKEIGVAYDEAMKTRVFAPLGMSETTFDQGRALRGDHAAPHSEDIDGKPAVASMDQNRSIYPLRPAGAAWSSARDLSRYVQMELAKGTLPDGKRLVSETNLLARRIPQVTIGESTTYGMGLEVNTKYGVPVVHHGGSMFGFKSDMFWLPEQGIGGVILTNSDSGRMLLGTIERKVLEVLFDGKPEAADDLASRAKERQASILEERTHLVVPPAADVVATLAPRYTNPALGDVTVRSAGPSRIFDFGEWKSAIASRKNEDGTSSLVTIDPAVDGFAFVVSQQGGKRALTLHDMQKDYVFVEGP